ncbi:hypothetical protein RhiJN_21311 [Ceratobasidium sp. AG-Ba]|nr:hypothetical protein RhiJN_21311 [Ceratobasidium sp. AG-Ba]
MLRTINRSPAGLRFDNPSCFVAENMSNIPGTRQEIGSTGNHIKMGRRLALSARFPLHSRTPAEMPPKLKPAITLRRTQSKSKPTVKHPYLPPDLSGTVRRKASNDVSGEDDQGYDGDESDTSNHDKNQDLDVVEENEPQFYDRDGNPVSVEEIAAIVLKYRLPIDTEYTRESQNSKKRQLTKDEPDEEEPTPAPTTPKRRRYTESSDEVEIIEEEEVESEVEEVEAEEEIIQEVKEKRANINPKKKATWNTNNVSMNSFEKTALYITNRKTFQELCGYNKAHDAEPQRVDKHGHPIYWKQLGGKSVVTPAWNFSPERNWHEWGTEFINIFRKKSKSSPQRHFLDRLTEQTIFAHFKAVSWPGHKKYASLKENNTFQASVEKHNRRSMINTRTNALLAKRNGVRKGTLIEGEVFDPVFAKAAQSPQYIDPIKKNHVIRIEPEWISKEAIKLKAGADLLIRLNDKRGTTVEYLKYNIPIARRGGGKQYPRWMVSDDYIKTHADEWKDKRYMFDLQAKTMPDTHGFTKSIGKSQRIYLDEPPEWLQLQLEADFAAPSRPIPHSVSTHVPSATNGAGTVQKVTKTGP